ncbi:MAG: hypothetical protein H6747_04155 [Deltaproteobacteria bacterium]|nr:hypothetical protein [Deltaproteobacteria bacterium]
MAFEGGTEPRVGRAQLAVVSVLLVAVGATVAFGWPRVLDREHGIDAMTTLGRIARGAAVYYVKPRGDKDGVRMRCQFPQGLTRSTPAKSCCDPQVNLPGTPYCDPAKTMWDTTIWKTVGVEVQDPQPFVFEYQAKGELGEARYVVRAYGDLDCDGTMSTFEFVGTGDPDATPENCVLRTTPVFRSDAVGE